MKKNHGKASGIPLKKQYGQHFLRDARVVQEIVNAVDLTADSSVFEIGCGDGFLTRAILTTPIARLLVFEIDPAWAQHVGTCYADPRMQIVTDNILDADLSRMEAHKPWILLANLPYQITFPILYKLQAHRHLLQEGVIMAQEEVAQKIVATHGRGYGLPSLFFQYYFSWRLLSKIPPGAFYPPPKVHSRLLHFKVRSDVLPIPHEERFWKFIKACFRQPRRTLKNNLMQAALPIERLSDEILSYRAQQCSFAQLQDIWHTLIS